MKLSELVAQLTAELIKNGDCEVIGTEPGASSLSLHGVGVISIKSLRTDKGLELNIKRELSQADLEHVKRVIELLEKTKERAEKYKVYQSVESKSWEWKI